MNFSNKASPSTTTAQLRPFLLLALIALKGDGSGFGYCCYKSKAGLRKCRAQFHRGCAGSHTFLLRGALLHPQLLHCVAAARASCCSRYIGGNAQPSLHPFHLLPKGPNWGAVEAGVARRAQGELSGHRTSLCMEISLEVHQHSARR